MLTRGKCKQQKTENRRTKSNRNVSGRQSSRVTKVPLAKLHRVFKFMESLSVMERNRKRRKVK